MNRRGFLKGLAGLSLCPLCASPALAQHWTYADEDKWSEEFPACGGNTQSPMTTNVFGTEYKPTISVAWVNRAHQIENTGHYIKVTFPNNNGGTLTIDNKSYTLNQFHFHCPSEHRWAASGEQYPMEIHFVHDQNGSQPLVVAVAVREYANSQGARQNTVANFIANLPKQVNGVGSAAGVDPNTLLPANEGLNHQRYAGSLTTPPCTQGVEWIVLRHPIYAADLIKAVSELYPNSARRPKPRQLFLQCQRVSPNESNCRRVMSFFD